MMTRLNDRNQPRALPYPYTSSYTRQQMHLLFKPLLAGFSVTAAKSILTNP